MVELLKDQFIICLPKKPMMVPTSSLECIHQSRNPFTPAQLMKMKLSFWIQLMTMVMPPLVVSLITKIFLTSLIIPTQVSVRLAQNMSLDLMITRKPTGLSTMALASASRTDNYITKIVLTDDGGGSEFEPHKITVCR